MTPKCDLHEWLTLTASILDAKCQRCGKAVGCDWEPDELNPGPDCPYCAGDMCARFDGLGCTHNRIERHGYGHHGGATA